MPTALEAGEPHDRPEVEQEPLLGRPGDVSQEEGRTIFRNPFIGTGILAQAGVVLLLAVIWGGVFSHDLLLPFSLHPLLNSTAIVLNVQAILLLQPTLTANQKKQGAVIHSIINGTAALAFAGAFGIILVLHQGLQFKSAHAILGLITYISIFSAGAFGAAMFYFPVVLGGTDKAKSLWRFHRLFGYIVLLLQLATISLATKTYYVENVLHIKTAGVVVGGVLTVLGVFPRIKRFKLGF